MTSSLLTRAVLAAALTLTACGSDDSGESSAASTLSSSASASATESSAEPASDESFGAGCAAIPAEGEGSFAGMADDPVGTALSNNPALPGLVQALTAANLVGTLNSTDNITVLAPANSAFDASPADQRAALLADTARLTALLTHHVLPGRLTPDQLAGTHVTLNNDEVTIEGEGETFTVPADQTLLGAAPATVVCGNVQTANATVYIIDQVLTPPAA